MTTPGEVCIRAIAGFGEVEAGADLAAEIVALVPLLSDGDIVVITSKIVSKSEGRVVAADNREAAIDAESVRTVATAGSTRIVATKHGFVMAAAGVDGSNVAPGQVVLLPEDPDQSARKIRQRIGQLSGRQVAVVITDTFGRPWREGQTDQGIGAAGLAPMIDLRGRIDRYGRTLDATVTAVIDEIAAAADLVKGKLSGMPVAVLTGLGHLVIADDGLGARAVIRAPEHDLFRLGTSEAKRMGARSAVSARRSVRQFDPRPIDPATLESAAEAAMSAPAPHHTKPIRFVRVDRRRTQFLDAMADQWRADLAADGLDDAAIGQRLRRGDLLRNAPAIVVPCLVRDGAHNYPDERRSRAEGQMFDLAAGAAIEAFLVQLTALELASCWVSSTLFCPDVAAKSLQLPADWEPLGAIAIGWPAQPIPDRSAIEVSGFIIDR